MKKRIVPILLCLVLAVAAVVLLPENAQAATAQETGNAVLNAALALDGTFPSTDPEGDGYQAYCPACGDTKTWYIMSDAYIGTKGADGGHYYMADDCNSSTSNIYNKQFFQLNTNKTVCFLSRQKLALIEGEEGGELGTGTIVSDTDIELPL